jgi:cell division protein FtsL
MTSRATSSKSRPGLGAILMHLLPVVLLCAGFAALGIVHVASRVMVVGLGYQLSHLDQESRTLGRENDRLKLELATLRGPHRLEKIAREELGMSPPPGTRVITLAAEAQRKPKLAQGRAAPSAD